MPPVRLLYSFVAHCRCYCCFCIANYAIMRIQEMPYSRRDFEWHSGKVHHSKIYSAMQNATRFAVSIANKFLARSLFFTLPTTTTKVSVIFYGIYPHSEMRRVLFFVILWCNRINACSSFRTAWGLHTLSTHIAGFLPDPLSLIRKLNKHTTISRCILFSGRSLSSYDSQL